jgi:hypothetical protein
MNPIKIDGSNRVYRKPDSMTDEECASLHVRSEMVEFRTILSSAWQPTLEEIERMLKGAPVILTIHGMDHPPVSLQVGEGSI